MCRLSDDEFQRVLDCLDKTVNQQMGDDTNAIMDEQEAVLDLLRSASRRSS